MALQPPSPKPNGIPQIPSPPMVPGAPAARPAPRPGAPGAAKMSGPPPAGAKPPGPGVPSAAPAPGEVEEEGLPQLGFWQLPWVQNVLPFVTSLVTHAAILIVAVLFAKVVVMKIQQANKEQTIIPESTMADSGPPGGVPNVGTGGDVLKQAMQDKFADQGSASGWAQKKGPLDAPPTSEGGGEGQNDNSGIIAMGGGGLGKGGAMGAGSGEGNGGGTGDGAGALAMFGQPGGGGIGPKGPVFGNGGNARRIAFVCDASGSMLNKFAALKLELQKAVEGLRPIQSFNIIFFHDTNAIALDKNSLVAANPDDKRKAYSFLENVTTTGTTDPIPGLRIAFQQQPQLLYLLTDGDFPDNKAVLAEIRSLNKDHKVKINTIAFVNDKDTDVDFVDLLKTIAQESGGQYRHVAENELNN